MDLSVQCAQMPSKCYGPLNHFHKSHSRKLDHQLDAQVWPCFGDKNLSTWNEALKKPDSRTCCSLVVLVHEVLVVIHSFMCMYLCFQFFPIIVWTDSLRLMLSFSFVLFLCYLLCFIINIAAVYFFDRYFVSTNATSTFHSIVSSYPGRLTLVTVQVSFYSYGSYVFFLGNRRGCAPTYYYTLAN